jgi:hypothetical protein
VTAVTVSPLLPRMRELKTNKPVCVCVWGSARRGMNHSLSEGVVRGKSCFSISSHVSLAIMGLPVKLPFYGVHNTPFISVS